MGPARDQGISGDDSGSHAYARLPVWDEDFGCCGCCALGRSTRSTTWSVLHEHEHEHEHERLAEGCTRQAAETASGRSVMELTMPTIGGLLVWRGATSSAATSSAARRGGVQHNYVGFGCSEGSAMRAESGGRKRVNHLRRHNVASCCGVWRRGQWGNHNPLAGSVNVMARKVRGWLTAQDATPALLKGNLNSTSRCRQPGPAKTSQHSTKQGPAAEGQERRSAGAQAWASRLPIAISRGPPTSPRPFPQATRRW